MATWTNISDTVLEPGKPARSIDALALRDNTAFVKDTHGYQVFTSSGTFTPPVGITSFRVIIIGGGGGAGYGYQIGESGNAGGDGGAIETVVSGMTNSNYAVVVGAAGAGGGITGGNGGSSSVFGLVVGGGSGGVSNAYGGARGANGSTPPAMIRGTAATPRLNIGYGGGGFAGNSSTAVSATGKAGVVIIEW